MDSRLGGDGFREGIGVQGGSALMEDQYYDLSETIPYGQGTRPFSLCGQVSMAK